MIHTISVYRDGGLNTGIADPIINKKWHTNVSKRYIFRTSSKSIDTCQKAVALIKRKQACDINVHMIKLDVRNRKYFRKSVSMSKYLSFMTRQIMTYSLPRTILSRMKVFYNIDRKVVLQRLFCLRCVYCLRL